MHSGQHHVSSDNPFRGSPRLVSKSKLHNLAPWTAVSPGLHAPASRLSPYFPDHPASASPLGCALSPLLILCSLGNPSMSTISIFIYMLLTVKFISEVQLLLSSVWDLCRHLNTKAPQIQHVSKWTHHLPPHKAFFYILYWKPVSQGKSLDISLDHPIFLTQYDKSPNPW